MIIETLGKVEMNFLFPKEGHEHCSKVYLN